MKKRAINKRVIIELIITAVIFITELIIYITKRSLAGRIVNYNAYVAALLGFFIVFDLFYFIVISIINSGFIEKTNKEKTENKTDETNKPE